ncbi:MAG: T9SS type A sorting domain-containing protein, partial [Saprospiraceae bacterium]
MRHPALLLLCMLAISAGLPAQISWQKVNGPNEGVNALTATDDNVLFLGTNNYGVFTSTDGGVSWSAENQGLSDILIRHLSASSNNEVFAGTAINGIYKYNSGSWTQINTGLGTNNMATAGFAQGSNGAMYMISAADGIYKWDGATWTNIKFNLPALVRAIVVGSTGILYAGCFNSGVYQFDGLNTWTSLGAMPNSYVTRMVISSTNTLYVACNSNNVYRIPASGGPWTSINTGLPALNATMMGIDAGNNLFLGFSVSGYGNIYRSTNSGDSWTNVSGALATSQFLSFCGTNSGDSYVGGSGVYKSGNNGADWQDMNPGLDARKAIASFKAAADGTLFVGTQLAGVWRSTDNGDTWQQKNIGLTTIYSFQITTNAAGNILYSAIIPGSTTTGVLFRSTNNGDSWTQVASNGTDIYTKIKQHNADTIWVSGRFGGPVLAYSINKGATWVNRPIPGFSAIWDIEMNAGSTIFLGSESEGVSRSTDGGNTWTLGVGNSMAWYGNVIEVELDHTGYLFAGTDWYHNILWFSPPGSNGNAWTKFLDPDLDGIADIYDLVFDINNNAYLATGNTPYKDPVYMAANAAWDANTDWVSVSNGLPLVAEAAEFGFDPTGYMYTAFYQSGQEGGLYRSTLPVNISAPLPIELLSFTGYNRDNHNHLHWSTATESQNEQFEIEKSLEGIHFMQIGKVAGQGNSNVTHNYSLTDFRVSPGKNYYRLHQIDIDGKDRYSKIIALNNGDYQSDLKAFPNPVKEVLHFSKNVADFAVFNLYGQKVTAPAESSNSLSVAHLPDGIYFVRTADAVAKFVV